MPKIVFINTDDKELPLELGYGDVGDAAGHLDGGDAWNDLTMQYGTQTIKAVRIDFEEPCLIKDDSEEGS